MNDARRTIALTVAALIGFAANSLLCRAALGAGAIDAATFTAVRLISGAAVLGLLARRAAGGERPHRRAGSWLSALALAAYAGAFSWAYLRIAAGVGALVLFGAVQLTMIAWGIRRGERPAATEWIGLAVASGGLVAFAAPGARAPDVLGVLAMAVAGVAWGAYSLRGRGVERPLAATAENFMRTVPLACVLLFVGLADGHASSSGIALAIASGAIASGLGYSLWYAALPELGAVRAAIVQLSVPALAAAGGVVLLAEQLDSRLLIGGAAVLGGVALALVGRRR
jgi:drug/metabolite transporter (DMT)-like permease